MRKLKNRRTTKRFMKGVCACAIACAVSLNGLPSIAVVPLVQAEKNSSSWVQDDDYDWHYYYTDANGWKYNTFDDPDDPDIDYCYLDSVPEGTTEPIKVPKSIIVDGKKFNVYVGGGFEATEGVKIDTLWVYDEDKENYYYTDSNGWKYSTPAINYRCCYLEKFPEDMTGELVLPLSSTVTIDGGEYELKLRVEDGENKISLPAGITSLVTKSPLEYDSSFFKNFFKNANPELVVHGYAWDSICIAAEELGIKVDYVNVITDEQGVQYNILLKEEEESFEKEESNEVSVFRYTGKGGTVTIPKTVGDKNYTVTVIGYDAFKKSKITGITLPDTVQSIGFNAFEGCTDLTSIKIPNSDCNISRGAFKNCSKLKSITLPTNLCGIEEQTFYKCTSLTSINIPDSAAYIGIEAFYGCSKLKEIKFGTKIKSIGIEPFAFAKCTSLTTLTLPDNITEIYEKAFYGCNKLKKITLGKKITFIAASAFGKCTKLKTVTIKSTKLSQIGESAFNGDKALKTITLKTQKLTKKSIGKNAFKGTNKSLVIKVPSKKVTAYKKFLNKFGNKTLTVKKN